MNDDLAKRIKPGDATKLGRAADKVLRTKHDVKVEVGAQNSRFTETWSRPSSKLHTGAKRERTTFVDSVSGKGTSKEKYKAAELTPAGRATAWGGLAAGYGGVLYADSRKRNPKKKVSKAMDPHAADPFGIGEIAKADKKKPKPPSGGRMVTGTIFPGFHGAIAGKKGSKVKAAGVQYGSALGGGLAGMAATRNPAGAQLGNLAGGAASTKYIHDKGWLKPQKKK